MSAQGRICGAGWSQGEGLRWALQVEWMGQQNECGVTSGGTGAMSGRVGCRWACAWVCEPRWTGQESEYGERGAVLGCGVWCLLSLMFA